MRSCTHFSLKLALERSVDRGEGGGSEVGVRGEGGGKVRGEGGGSVRGSRVQGRVGWMRCTCTDRQPAGMPPGGCLATGAQAGVPGSASGLRQSHAACSCSGRQ